jgi:hypothetical protein
MDVLEETFSAHPVWKKTKINFSWSIAHYFNSVSLSDNYSSSHSIDEELKLGEIFPRSVSL